MDVLACTVKTMSYTEVSKFKRYLNQKAKGHGNKKLRLFKHLIKGVSSIEIRKTLYNVDVANNAYYQLRKSLLDDLEQFILVEQLKHKNNVNVFKAIILGNRSYSEGHSELANNYYNEALELAKFNHNKPIMDLCLKAKEFINETGLYDNYAFFKQNNGMSNAELVNYPIHFFTYLTDKDFIPFADKLNAHLNDLDNQNLDQHYYKAFFLSTYANYRLKNYHLAQQQLTQVKLNFKLKDNFPKHILIWTQLLEVFIEYKMGNGYNALVLLEKLKETHFLSCGKHLKLIILRWTCYIAFKLNRHYLLEFSINEILNLNLDYDNSMERKQTIKLFIFIKLYCRKNNLLDLEERSERTLNVLIKQNHNLTNELDGDKTNSHFTNKYINLFVKFMSKNQLFWAKTPEDLIIKDYYLNARNHSELKYA